MVSGWPTVFCPAPLGPDHPNPRPPGLALRPQPPSPVAFDHPRFAPGVGISGARTGANADASDGGCAGRRARQCLRRKRFSCANVMHEMEGLRALIRALDSVVWCVGDVVMKGSKGI